MFELKPLYLCIDTSKAVPLTSGEITNFELQNLDEKEIQSAENQADISKTDP